MAKRRRRLTHEQIEAIRQDYLRWNPDDPDTQTAREFAADHGISMESFRYYRNKWELDLLRGQRPSKTVGTPRPEPWKGLLNKFIDEQANELMLRRQLEESQRRSRVLHKNLNRRLDFEYPYAPRPLE